MNNSMEERLIVVEESNPGLKERFRNESKMIWRVAFPGILARVSMFGILIVTQSFIGQLGDVELASFALVQSITVRFVNGILIGMSSATETLCGQAFGAGQYHMLGIYLQRSWIIDAITTTILLPLFIFATPILKLLGQEKEIAEVAEGISLWFIPFLYAIVISLTMQMYLQSQMKNNIIGWLSSFSFGVHVALSWLFVSKFKLGIFGAMLAINISSWGTAIGEFVYVFGGWCRDTWKGFDIAAFSDIWPAIKLSLSSGVMLCLEMWYLSILVLIAGYMKNAAVAISAFSICINLSLWEFMICLGFMGAASVRVSNELGRGNAKAVRFSIKVILSTASCIGVFFWLIWFFFHREISYLFTSDEEVVESISDLSLLLGFTILVNSVQPVLSGVAVGAGMQSIVAFVNLGCYYGIGIPLGALLGYVAHLQVKGLWIGMLGGVVIQTIVLSYIVWKTNWDEQVKKASQRLNRWFMDSSMQSDLPLNHPSKWKTTSQDLKTSIVGATRGLWYLNYGCNFL